MIQFAEVDSAYEALKDAYHHLCQAGRTLADARLSYQMAEARQILAGVEGKNEIERKARLLDTLQRETEEVHAAEQEMRNARYCADVAHAEVNRLHCHLRLLDYARLISENPV